MREIKFRGKDIRTKEWVYGDLWHYQNRYSELCMIFSHTDGLIIAHYVDKETIGQYTGMRDKKGEEVYEGDIVDVHDWTSVYATPYRGDVVFIGKWAVRYWDRITKEHNHISLFFDDFAERKTEVIGNVFDNPELLKAENNEMLGM